MAKEKSRYKYGEYIIRPIKGRYYVYKRENVNGEVKERYVGSLSGVIESYLKLKDSSGSAGVPPQRTRRDLNPGPQAPEACALSWLSYGSITSYSRVLYPVILNRFSVRPLLP